MRILHLQHFLDIGGSDVMLLELARRQKQLGHAVSICAMFGEGPFDGKARDLGIPLFHLHSKNKPLAKIRALHAFLAAHRSEFDILHSHWGVWLAAAVAGRLERIPVVHTHHSNQPRRLFPEHRLATLFTDKVVCLTPDLEPYIAKWVNVPRRKIEIIPNGIDLARIDAATRIELDGIPPAAPVVGMVARLSPPKDYTTFLQAARLLNDTLPDVHFLAVGNGGQRAHFEALAQSLGVRNLHFLGGRSDVPSILRRISVSVLATGNEGLPLSLLEAMAAGCLPVATDIPPNRFTLDDGRAGLLVPAKDAPALAIAITQALTDHDLRGRLLPAALARGREFDSRLMAERYLALYRRLAPPSTAPGALNPSVDTSVDTSTNASIEDSRPLSMHPNPPGNEPAI